MCASKVLLFFWLADKKINIIALYERYLRVIYLFMQSTTLLEMWKDENIAVFYVSIGWEKRLGLLEAT